MGADERTLSDVHRDVDFANRYRLEYIKHLISVAAALFLLSVAFMKDVLGVNSSQAHFKVFLGLAWLFLIVSTIAGIFHLRSWAEFYITYLKPFKDKEANKRRRVINYRRKVFENCQLIFFGLSLLCFLIFAVRNLMV